MPNVTIYAKALLSLHQAGLLNDSRCKHAVGVLIRQSTETAHWHATADYRSEAAAAEIAKMSFFSQSQYHAWCKSNLRHEHIVPTSVIIEILSLESFLTEPIIEKILRTYGLRASILIEEDAELNKRGFKKKMPSWFWQSDHQNFRNPLARYMETGLDKTLIKRSNSSWFELEKDELPHS